MCTCHCKTKERLQKGRALVILCQYLEGEENKHDRKEENKHDGKPQCIFYFKTERSHKEEAHYRISFTLGPVYMEVGDPR